MGKILGGFGRDFERDLESLGPLGSFLELFFSCLCLEWSSKGLLEASGLDFGSILRGFGWVLGGFGEDFEGSGDGFWGECWRV